MDVVFFNSLTRQAMYVTYVVTLRGVRGTVVTVQKQEVLYILCVSACACVALVIQHAKHMGYIVICGLRGYAIFFPHYIIKGAIFGLRVLNIKCVF
jgi:hypothetical protein